MYTATLLRKRGRIEGRSNWQPANAKPDAKSAQLKREGWTLEIQSAKALVKRQDSALSVSPAQAVAMTLAQRGERHVERMAGVSEIAFAVGFLIAVVDRSSPSIARQKSILSKATLVGDNAH
jgi:hypothetical protein